MGQKVFTSNLYIDKIVMPMQLTDSSEGFDCILLEAVDEALSVLGGSFKQVTYFHLKQAFNIKKHEIPSKIREFTKAIEALFGEGAAFVEVQIMKCLKRRLGNFRYVSKNGKLTFINYVKAAKKSYESA